MNDLLLYQKKMLKAITHHEGIALREETIEKLRDMCTLLYPDLCVLPFRFLLNMERGIYNSSIIYCKDQITPPSWSNFRFVNHYQTKLEYIVLLFSTPRYGNCLFLDLTEKRLLPHEICFKKEYELFPQYWESVLLSKKQLSPNEMLVLTDQFQCPMCNEKKCSYHEMQTRSADEPTTIFVMCFVCKHQWRM